HQLSPFLSKDKKQELSPTDSPDALQAPITPKLLPKCRPLKDSVHLRSATQSRKICFNLWRYIFPGMSDFDHGMVCICRKCPKIAAIAARASTSITVPPAGSGIAFEAIHWPLM
ncbi:MAG: hypothetical protein RL481_60, partial [Pseudomonadota bacterium]